MASRLDKTQGTTPETPPEMASDEAAEAVAGAQAVWSDTVDIPAESLSIPFLSLAQALSKAVVDEQAKMGEWTMSGYEALKEVIIVPLKFGVGRNFSIVSAEGTLETACYSPTGHEHGIALLDEGPGIACTDCPLKEWQPTDKVDARGKKINDPPPCKESYDFLVWSHTHGTFARVGFRSTGLQAGRLLATLGKTKGLGQFAVQLTSTKKTGKRGTYAVPVVTILNAEQAANMLETAQSMMALGAGS